MPDEINDLRVFAQMVDAGSLSAAARQTDGSAAAMSRRLAALEKRLGVRLVTRTSRRFELTVEGALFHERALTILQAVDDAEAEISAQARVPQGLVCIGAPSEIGRKQIAPLIEAFSDHYPEVEVRLVLSDIGLDVIDDNLDVALRIGLPPDTGVVAKRLLSSRRIVCAAPEYLARCGHRIRPPTSPGMIASGWFAANACSTDGCFKRTGGAGTFRYAGLYRRQAAKCCTTGRSRGAASC